MGAPSGLLVVVELGAGVLLVSAGEAGLAAAVVEGSLVLVVVVGVATPPTGEHGVFPEGGVPETTAAPAPGEKGQFCATTSFMALGTCPCSLRISNISGVTPKDCRITDVCSTFSANKQSGTLYRRFLAA
jgi:hypothetical protein